MINTEDFIVRLQKIINYYNLSASAFADKISVQRSSISHILSGRNKPSLEFVMKILNHFPEVNLYWLLNGKGKFPSEEKLENTIRTKPPTPKTIDSSKNENNIKIDDDIDRIIIFYKDGTFKNFKN
ncbi:helix-turn-helix domain-containing protein [Flavobacteriaceae bacterium AU392]|nr:XRE family transcriptional regulator [Flavobacteriaceae bacterium]RKM85526.1 helix-turn-helix domain-containing protein [Flavobacteriaceae bacterium AU392]